MSRLLLVLLMGVVGCATRPLILAYERLTPEDIPHGETNLHSSPRNIRAI